MEAQYLKLSSGLVLNLLDGERLLLLVGREHLNRQVTIIKDFSRLKLFLLKLNIEKFNRKVKRWLRQDSKKRQLQK